MTYTNKHILVVGGSRGTGIVLAKDLLHEGACVSCLSRTAPLEPVDDSGFNHQACDITDRPAVHDALRACWRLNGPPWGIVCMQRARADGDAWELELSTSLSATREIIEASAPLFGSNGGRIVLIGSIATDHIAREQPLSYHVCKAGLEQMMRYYAVVLGEQKICVNMVSPGIILKPEARDFYKQQENLLALYRRIVPLKRMGVSGDVSALIRLLLREDVGYLTGQNIVLDGGMSLLWQENVMREAGDMGSVENKRMNEKDI